MYHDLEFYTRIFQKIINFLIPLYLQRKVLIPRLIIISILPKDANTNQILTKLIRTPQVRTREKTQPAAVNFQWLVYSELHGEISCFFGIS